MCGLRGRARSGASRAAPHSLALAAARAHPRAPRAFPSCTPAGARGSGAGSPCPPCWVLLTLLGRTRGCQISPSTQGRVQTLGTSVPWPTLAGHTQTRTRTELAEAAVVQDAPRTPPPGGTHKHAPGSDRGTPSAALPPPHISGTHGHTPRSVGTGCCHTARTCTSSVVQGHCGHSVFTLPLRSHTDTHSLSLSQSLTRLVSSSRTPSPLSPWA